MTDRYIDFQSFPQETEAPVRKSFRVPVSEKNNILAVFQDQPFSVANLSGTGIAIFTDSGIAFEQGQILKDVQLVVDTTRLAGLTGKVVHCSVHASGQWQFGIEWQDMAEANLARMMKVVETIKAQALKEDGLAKDEAWG